MNDSGNLAHNLLALQETIQLTLWFTAKELFDCFVQTASQQFIIQPVF